MVTGHQGIGNQGMAPFFELRIGLALKTWLTSAMAFAVEEDVPAFRQTVIGIVIAICKRGRERHPVPESQIGSGQVVIGTKMR